MNPTCVGNLLFISYFEQSKKQDSNKYTNILLFTEKVFWFTSSYYYQSSKDKQTRAEENDLLCPSIRPKKCFVGNNMIEERERERERERD